MCPGSRTLLSDKERDVRHLESESTASSRKLQQLETTLGNLNSQMKSKQEELRGEFKQTPDTIGGFLSSFGSLRNWAEAAPRGSFHRRGRSDRC